MPRVIRMGTFPTILLTGAGGAAIPFLIESLRNQGCRILAADMDPFASGLLLADKGFIIPKADAPAFSQAIEKICKTESVDIIIPLVDEELITVSELQLGNTIALLPRTDFIRTCLDKYALIQELKRCRIPAPNTILANDDSADIIFPCIVKPRTGRGSRNVEIIQTKADYNIWKSHFGDISEKFILQDYLPGTEYTVSVVAWRDGRVQAVVPKEILVKKGITRLAVTRYQKEIDEYCRSIQKHLKADGPFNVQLRCDTESGNPQLFEINPRFSTTVSLTTMAGIDELYGLVMQALKGPDAYHFGEWKEGIVLMRHYQDTCVSGFVFEQMKSNIMHVR